MKNDCCALGDTYMWCINKTNDWMAAKVTNKEVTGKLIIQV